MGAVPAKNADVIEGGVDDESQKKKNERRPGIAKLPNCF